MKDRVLYLFLAFLITLLIFGPIIGITYFVVKKMKEKRKNESENATPSTTAKFGNAEENELVLCHAGYCGYCKDFLPKFNEAVPILRARYRTLKITTYQHETQMEMIRQIQPPVEYYPTMRLNGQEFEGPRTAEGVIEFVEKYINAK